MPVAKRRGELTKQEELNYLVTWFDEFSEMQKSDFFKIILKKYAGSNLDTELIASAIEALKVADRPPTIFQCRMKLFDNWFANWSDEEKEDLLIRLKNLDSQFMETFQGTLDGKELEEETFKQPILQLYPTKEATTTNGHVSPANVPQTISIKQTNGNGIVTNGEPETPSPTQEGGDEPEPQSNGTSTEQNGIVESPVESSTEPIVEPTIVEVEG